MGFFKDKAAETQAAVNQGKAEQAAAAVVQAMLEGDGSMADNLAKLTAEVNRQQGRR